MGQIDGAMSRVIERNRTNILQLLFVFVVANSVPFAISVNDVPVARIGHDEAAFAIARLKPIFPTNRS